MKKLLTIFVAILVSSCATPVDDMAQAINGYWNIDKVELSDGSDREFPFSNHMDHFSISKTRGVKNRVSPTYDGKFINYNSPVPFKWEKRDGKLFLLFNDGTEKYEQQVVDANEETMELLHENGTRYLYKRYINKEFVNP
jgi:hypothetical protein